MSEAFVAMLFVLAVTLELRLLISVCWVLLLALIVEISLVFVATLVVRALIAWS